MFIGYWFEAAAKLVLHPTKPYFRIGQEFIRLNWNTIDICFVFVDFCPDLRRFFISRDLTVFTGFVRGRRRMRRVCSTMVKECCAHRIPSCAATVVVKNRGGWGAAQAVADRE